MKHLDEFWWACQIHVLLRDAFIGFGPCIDYLPMGMVGFLFNFQRLFNSPRWKPKPRLLAGVFNARGIGSDLFCCFRMVSEMMHPKNMRIDSKKHINSIFIAFQNPLVWLEQDYETPGRKPANADAGEEIRPCNHRLADHAWYQQQHAQNTMGAGEKKVAEISVLAGWCLDTTAIISRLF